MDALQDFFFSACIILLPSELLVWTSLHLNICRYFKLFRIFMLYANPALQEAAAVSWDLRVIFKTDYYLLPER